MAYRPSDAWYIYFASLFHSLFVNLVFEVNYVIRRDDTNIDLESKISSDSNYLHQLLEEINTIQLINESTRVTATSATLLNHTIADRLAEVTRTGLVDATVVY